MIISAILTAAGASRRMGSFKPMEEINGFPMAQMSARLLLDAGVAAPVAVCAANAPEPAGRLAAMGFRIAWNPDPKDADMLESVKIGIRALPECDAFFMLPADMPLISPKSLSALAESFKTSGADFILPTFWGKNGHPPLIHAAQIPHILSYHGEGGLKGALNMRKKLTLPLDDPGLVMDADHPEELLAVRAEAKKRRGLSARLCETLLDEFPASAQTRAHCHAVAETLRGMTSRLNRRGFALDSELCYSAGLLHDAFKGLPRHDRLIREELENRGYSALARVAGGHMRFCDAPSLKDEASLLTLADRLTFGTELVSPEERYREKLARFTGDPEVYPIVRRDYERCMTLYEEYLKYC